jgi:hypothetical protein
MWCISVEDATDSDPALFQILPPQLTSVLESENTPVFRVQTVVEHVKHNETDESFDGDDGLDKTRILVGLTYDGNNTIVMFPDTDDSESKINYTTKNYEPTIPGDTTVDSSNTLYLAD